MKKLTLSVFASPALTLTERLNNPDLLNGKEND